MEEANGKFSTWSEDAVVYGLPRTVLGVEYLATRIQFAKPKCPDADKSVLQKLGLSEKDIPPEGTTLFALAKPSLTPWAEPDPQEIFRMAPTTDGILVDSTLQVKLGENGIIEYAQATAVDQLGPTIAKTIEVVANIAGAALLLGAEEPEKRLSKEECTAALQRFEELSKAADLWRVPSPYPKDTYDALLAGIREELSAIRNLFLGVKSVSAATVHCDIRPDEDDLKDKTTASIVFLELHPEAGLKATDRGDCRIPANFAGSGGKKKAELSVRLTGAAKPLVEAWKERSAEATSAGFFYRIPAPVQIALEGPDKLGVGPTRMMVAQLGVVGSMERARGRNPKLTVELHGATGALKSVTVEHNAPDVVGMLGAAGTGATTVIGAIGKHEELERTAKAAEEAKKTPLALLKEEQATLEAELAIHQAREALRQYQEIP
jgi:hypothetical protein